MLSKDIASSLASLATLPDNYRIIVTDQYGVEADYAVDSKDRLSITDITDTNLVKVTGNGTNDATTAGADGSKEVTATAKITFATN